MDAWTGWFPLLIGLLAVEFAVETLADALNLGSFAPEMSAELRSEFDGLFDSERHVRARHYLAANTRLAIAERTVRLVALVGFIVLGGFQWVDHWARASTASPILRGLLFAAALSVLRGLISLPFSLASTFGIEARFGFNRTDWRTFVSDRIKGLILGVLIGAPLFAAVLAFFEKAGTYGWAWAWLAVTIFQLLALFFAPALILPLFNKFTPLPEGELRQGIENYVRGQNFSIGGVYTMDGSRRSTKANAFFTGFGKLRRLVFFDTLLERNDQDEVLAVLAHEIGHFREGHIPKTIALSIVTSLAMFAALGWIIHEPRLHAAFGLEATSTYAGIVFASILYGPVLRFLGIGTQWLSRHHEYEADRWSARTYGRPDKLASALKKLSTDSLSHLTPHPLKVWLDYTHPPVIERVRALRRLERSPKA
jgi:STE24 endopeptidase